MKGCREKVLSFGPNRTVEVRPNRTFGLSLLSRLSDLQKQVVYLNDQSKPNIYNLQELQICHQQQRFPTLLLPITPSWWRDCSPKGWWEQYRRLRLDKLVRPLQKIKDIHGSNGIRAFLTGLLFEVGFTYRLCFLQVSKNLSSILTKRDVEEKIKPSKLRLHRIQQRIPNYVCTYKVSRIF